ncbi:MAG: AI-2E family transporter, partial [Desulfuromonadales bacterium]|nr:AI-2E family transporter [Desulfuromonadales bacterium]NIR33096.1 AI-2E family transporter [Desulfuromonadales bacterium]NIS41875.1 AI-2E family transporter [Desulfuromonadales bacterium]
MSRRILAWSLGALSLVLLAGVLYAARSVVIPFMLALLLAYFLDPAADFLEERRLSRSLAVVVVFSGFLVVAGVLLAFLVPAVKSEVADLQRLFPQYAQGLYKLLPDQLLEMLHISAAADLQAIFHRLLELGKNLSFDVVGQVALFVSKAFSSTLSFILTVIGYFIIPVYLFYLLRDFDRMKEGVVALIPGRYRESVLGLSREVDEVLSGFIRGQLTVCLVLAVLYSIGLVVIGIDLALLIGILSGLAFIIPYLGTILGIFFAGLMAVVKFHDLLHPLLVIGWFSIVQGLEGTIITPRIVGNRVGLHPVGTILAVLLGGEL